MLTTLTTSVQMRTTNAIIASCILAIIFAADQHEEMRCKARPGCHLAKCDPGLMPSSLNANEYPVTCVRSSVHDGEEYNDLKRNMQALQAAFASLNHKNIGMERNDAKISKEMEALKAQLSKSYQSNKELSKELNDLRVKTNGLESHLATPNTALVRSCEGAKLESALARNDSGGVFNSYIPTIGFRGIFCDVTDDGGNWTVFQRRMNGDVDFNRNWDDYVKGFGDLQGDHWLGLETMHQMTSRENMELKIKIIKRKGIYWVAKYSDFRIGPGSDKYRLHVSGYSGNATEDALEYHNNRQFSTNDADHDNWSRLNCASKYEAGWWYGQCAASNLNGNFNKTDVSGFWWGGGFFWEDFGGNLLRFSEMKFRKRL